MKLVTAFIITILLLSIPLFSQHIKVNDRGEKIIEYSDGSWKYFDKNDPADLKLETANTPLLNNPDSDLYSHIHKLYQASVDKEKSLTRSKEDNRLEKVMLQYNLDAQKKDLEEVEIKIIKQKLIDNKLALKQIEKSIQSTNKETRKLFSMLNMESEKRAKAYLKYLKSISKDKGLEIKKETSIAIQSPDKPIENTPDNSQKSINIKSEQLKNVQIKSRNAENYAQYNEAQDVYLHPLSKPCKVEAEGKDEFTGKNRKDLVPETWFFMTPEPMKNAFQNKEYINCSSSLSAISGGTVFLTINITIATLNANRLFGGLEKGSVITIKFLDGDNIAIINNRNDFGTINNNEQTVSYRAQCTLGSAVQDMIATKEIDKVRITWNAGYEDYEVFDVDLLMRQMKCLQ